MKNHPIHTVTKWIGNTPAIALKHYLQVHDSDFAKAVNGAADSGAVSNRQQRGGKVRHAAKP